MILLVLEEEKEKAERLREEHLEKAEKAERPREEHLEDNLEDNNIHINVNNIFI
jgi:hypothetical protein